jgi:hypothetical protein
MANPEHVEIVRQGSEAIEAFRKANPAVRLNLSSAKLSHAILAGLDLGVSFFMNADLSHADLSHTNLSHAELNDANLSHARLVGARLNSANLSDADLSDAELQGADLFDTILNRTQMRHVRLWSTTFCNVDLSDVHGLDSAKHLGPCTVGVDTLFLSKGRIPEQFLRGCGVPEDLITYLPSFAGTAFDYFSCFISHNKADKQFARQLHDRLQGKGIRCWLDEKQLNPGDDLYHEIDRGIRVWDKVLLCASKDSLASGWVDDEITIALEKEKELLKTTKRNLLKIIPLDLDGFMFSDEWQSGYRAMIRKRVAADFTKWKSDADEFERQFERVVRALRTDGGRLPEPKSKLGNTNRSFTE